MKQFIAIFFSTFVLLIGQSAGADAGHSHATGSAKSTGESAPIGTPAKGAKASRTIKISMNDKLRFDPEKIDVKSGETVKFVVTNVGQVRHEIVIGPEQELKEHAEMMKQMPDMKHSEDNQLVLEPGKSGQMVWQFKRAGKLQYGCFEPGHMEAGMQGEISVK
jgi:uncharacterized cupredoxin-like copper-binding protein